MELGLIPNAVQCVMGIGATLGVVTLVIVFAIHFVKFFDDPILPGGDD